MVRRSFSPNSQTDDFLVRGSLRLANESDRTYSMLAILNQSRRLAASKSSCSGLSMLRLVGVEDMSSDDTTTLVTMNSNTHKARGDRARLTRFLELRYVSRYVSGCIHRQNILDDWCAEVTALGTGFHWKPATTNRTNQISARGQTKTNQNEPIEPN